MTTLTPRLEIAAMAMQGMLANEAIIRSLIREHPIDCLGDKIVMRELCFEFADEFIAADSTPTSESEMARTIQRLENGIRAAAQKCRDWCDTSPQALRAIATELPDKTADELRRIAAKILEVSTK